MKHGDLLRRQFILARLALSFALDCALDCALDRALDRAPSLALSLALCFGPCMALDLALGMARLSSCLAPGLDGHSESHRSSTSCRYRRPHRLPGYSSRNDYPANRGHEAIGDGELGFR